MTPFLLKSRHMCMAMSTATLLFLTAPTIGQAEEFSDSQLKSFATAWTNINELAEQWKPQVEAAENQDKAAELLKQFEVQANQVIEQTEGIGTADYESILEAILSDPELKERVFAVLQDVKPQQ